MTAPARTGPAPLFSAGKDGVRVALRVVPRAARPGIAGRGARPDGMPCLRVSVSEPAEGGRANAAVLMLLARAWRLPVSSLTVALGAASRDKVVRIAGDPAALTVQLEGWAAAVPAVAGPDA